MCGKDWAKSGHKGRCRLGRFQPALKEALRNEGRCRLGRFQRALKEALKND
jgi:hypothetical protein